MSLRIGIFVMMFPQVSETFIVTKVLKMIDAGFDVHIFTVVESPHWEAFTVLSGRDDVRARTHVVPPLAPASAALVRGGLEVARTVLSHPTSFLRLVRHSWHHRAEHPSSFLKSIYTRIRFVGIELDILHVEFDTQGFGIADLKEFLGCHVLLSARGTFQQQSVLDRRPGAPAYLFRYVDGYHFISRFLKRNTVELGLPDEVPTWLIEPAIDLSLFAPRPDDSTDGVFRIISVGRLSWEKNYETALDAVALLNDRGILVDYTIFGAGPDAEPIRYAIHQLGLAHCARLGGVLRRDDAPAAYAAATVMLHSAVAEGFCNAVIEAQAMSLPVVTTDAGGLPENVDDGVTGFVVPRRDPQALAAKLEVLARDPALRARMGAAGRARALARFDLDRQAEAFVKLYRELAARPRRI
jgi:colanic acid/amylovoran biosynthesis glycosyltransferase